jgi:hypothetical protein
VTIRSRQLEPELPRTIGTIVIDDDKLKALSEPISQDLGEALDNLGNVLRLVVRG